MAHPPSLRPCRHVLWLVVYRAGWSLKYASTPLWSHWRVADGSWVSYGRGIGSDDPVRSHGSAGPAHRACAVNVAFALAAHDKRGQIEWHGVSAFRAVADQAVMETNIVCEG